MLPSDNSNAVQRAAQSINDRRVRHFYDPQRHVGKILAQSLGEPNQIAWDMYLFYAAGGEWGKVPPQPIAWVHQLSDSWLEHYCYGDDLEKELHEIAEHLLQT
jgi:hypothetical protein